jgi:hypothetical protein
LFCSLYSFILLLCSTVFIPPIALLLCIHSSRYSVVLCSFIALICSLVFIRLITLLSCIHSSHYSALLYLLISLLCSPIFIHFISMLPRILSSHYSAVHITSCQSWGIVRSAKRCRHCILCLLFSAALRLESHKLARSPAPRKLWKCTLRQILGR